MKYYFVLLGLFSFSTFGQQDGLFNQYWNNYSFINPAMAGVEYDHHGGILYRNQWQGITGAPNDMNGFYNANLGRSHGVGANFHYDNIGFNETKEFSLLYNYKFTLKDKHKFSVGVAPAPINFKSEGDLILPATMEDTISINYNETNLYTHLGVSYFREYFSFGFGLRNIPLQATDQSSFNRAIHY